MALLNIRSDWYLYIWLIYRKIYSVIIWLVGNHCQSDKGSVISAGVSQSSGSLHRVRTRRRKPVQHRKHVVALVRRSSLRRIVMAPGATAHAMMEDKEKILANGKSTFYYPFLELGKSIRKHVKTFQRKLRNVIDTVSVSIHDCFGSTSFVLVDFLRKQ